MCEYQRIARQSRSTASMPHQRKKAAGVKERCDREASFPSYRKKNVWEEDTEQSKPVQMKKGNAQKRKAQQRKKQRQEPPQQGVRRRRPQQLEQPGNQGRVQRMIAKEYYNLHAEPWNGEAALNQEILSNEESLSEQEAILGHIALDQDHILPVIDLEGYADLAGVILDREMRQRALIWDKTAGEGRTILIEEWNWLKGIIVDGLCGGWSVLHRANPERFAEVWTALADWDEEEDIAAHMNRYCIEPEMGWENYLISFADSAVGIMGRLEPDAGYGILPSDQTSELPDFNIAKALTNPNKTINVHVEASGAGADVYNCIVQDPFLKNKEGDPHIVHIETDKHHMSVRTRCISGTVRIEEIVESEYAGVVAGPDRRKAEFVLEHGIYLDAEEEDVPQPQTVTLEFFNAIKKKRGIAE